jgi:K+-transporting ATPase A subunit
MNPEILGIVAMFVITLLLALPLGRYMAKVFSNEPTFLDPLFNPIERFFFKFSGKDATPRTNLETTNGIHVDDQSCLVFVRYGYFNESRLASVEPR